MRIGSLTRRAVISLPLVPSYWLTPRHASWLTPREATLLQETQQAGICLQDLKAKNFQPLLDAVGGAHTVLLGEATHGTEEFYRIRSDISKALIEHAGFDAVLCEGDFSSFLQLNRYVGGAAYCRGDHCAYTAQEAFAGFRERFPVWMWRNDAFADFVNWMAGYNHRRDRSVQPVQLFGLDIYSLYQSIDQVLGFLDSVVNDTELAQFARDRYSTLERFPDATDYGKAAFYNVVPSQTKNAVEVLKRLRQEEDRLQHLPGVRQELWIAIQNAQVVVNAEAYYRQLFLSKQKDSGTLWNMREAAMFQTLQNIQSYIQREKGDEPAKVVIWAHNAHVGDARATNHAAKRRNEPPHFSLGQLCRQVFGLDDVYSVGFTCNEGTVRAVHEWGEQDRIMKLLPVFEGSHEYLLRELAASSGRRNIVGYCFRDNQNGDLVDSSARQLFSVPRVQRFVGVSYVPSTELQSHYSISYLGEEFDFLIHVDRSRAVKVDKVQRWKDTHGALLEGAATTKRLMYLLDAYGQD